MDKVLPLLVMFSLVYLLLQSVILLLKGWGWGDRLFAITSFALLSGATPNQK